MTREGEAVRRKQFGVSGFLSRWIFLSREYTSDVFSLTTSNKE